MKTLVMKYYWGTFETVFISFVRLHVLSVAFLLLQQIYILKISRKVFKFACLQFTAVFSLLDYVPCLRFTSNFGIFSVLPCLCFVVSLTLEQAFR